MELMTLWKGCANLVGISQWWDVTFMPWHRQLRGAVETEGAGGKTRYFR